MVRAGGSSHKVASALQKQAFQKIFEEGLAFRPTLGILVA
jgi:hypothetical protein